MLNRRLALMAGALLSLSTGLISCQKFSPDEPLPTPYTPTLFVSSDNQIVYALDPETGKRKWQASVDGAVKATPVVLGDALWVATLSGKLYKLDLQYGKEMMDPVDLSGAITGTPLIYGGNLLVPAGNRLVYVKADDITEIWSYDNGAIIPTSPTSHNIAGIQENAIFIAGTDNKVVALTPEGEEIWSYTPDDAGSFWSSPCVSNDSFLYIGNDNGNLYALRTQTGELHWRFAAMGRIQSSPIQIGGNVLVGSDDRNLYSVDSATGLLRWKIQTADRVVSSPIVYDQYVYFGSYDGKIYSVDIIDGTIDWETMSFGLIKASPVVYRGNIYVGSYDKNLFCLDAVDGKQRWVYNVEGQMETSPVIDSVGGAAIPSISGNYRY